jgi:DUF1707 SHOCT-like domain
VHAGAEPEGAGAMLLVTEADREAAVEILQHAAGDGRLPLHEFSGFVSFGIATFRAGVYPRWAGPVIAIGSAAAIVMAPLVSVPSGSFRMDRVGVLAASFAFVWCGWDLLRHATPPVRTGPTNPAETASGPGPGRATIAETRTGST